MMDRFTRIYSTILLVFIVVVLAVIFYESPKVGALNDALADKSELADYPYRFRVLEFDNGVATVSTPRAANFNAFRALRIIFPELANEPDDSPRLYEAQEELASVQALAAEAVRSDPDVRRVDWSLDEHWLRDNGINPDLL